MVRNIKDKDLLQSGLLFYFTVPLAQRDFEDALAFADSLPASLRDNVIWAAFRAAAHENPSGAAARALAMPAGKLREQAVASATAFWLEVDPQAAMAWVLERPNTPIQNFGMLLSGSMWRWAHSDPSGAASFVERFPAGKQRDEFHGAVATAWAYKDTAQALRWVERLPEGKVKVDAMERVMSVWGSEDPAAAAAFLVRQPVGEKTPEVLERIGVKWAENDPEGAVAWAASQPNAAALEKKIAPVTLGAIAADDPQRAVAGLAGLRTPEARAAAMTEIARAWARRDTEASARWVLELPVTDASRAALKEVIEAGTERDSAKMAQWLEGMAGHPQRDVAVEAFARTAMYYDPLAAAAWAQTLGGTATRGPLVRDILRNLANFDAPAARDWVLEHSFDDGERKTLLDQIEKQGEGK